jgi:hypothetical protein
MVVSLCGAVSGFVNALLEGDLRLPHREDDSYSSGWIGDVLVGAVAALVLWAAYHPSSRFAVIGESISDTKGILTIAEMAGSIVAGIGGARLLSGKVKKIGFRNARVPRSKRATPVPHFNTQTT